MNWYQYDADYYDDDNDSDDSQVQVGFNKEGTSGGSVPSLIAFTLSPSVLELDKNTNAKMPGQWIFSIGGDIISEPRSLIGVGRPGLFESMFKCSCFLIAEFFSFILQIPQLA